MTIDNLMESTNSRELNLLIKDMIGFKTLLRTIGSNDEKDILSTAVLVNHKELLTRYNIEVTEMHLDSSVIDKLYEYLYNIISPILERLTNDIKLLVSNVINEFRICSTLFTAITLSFPECDTNLTNLMRLNRGDKGIEPFALDGMAITFMRIRNTETILKINPYNISKTSVFNIRVDEFIDIYSKYQLRVGKLFNVKLPYLVNSLNNETEKMECEVIDSKPIMLNQPENINDGTTRLLLSVYATLLSGGIYTTSTTVPQETLSLIDKLLTSLLAIDNETIEHNISIYFQNIETTHRDFIETLYFISNSAIAYNMLLNDFVVPKNI